MSTVYDVVSPYLFYVLKGFIIFFIPTFLFNALFYRVFKKVLMRANIVLIVSIILATILLIATLVLGFDLSISPFKVLQYITDTFK